MNRGNIIKIKGNIKKSFLNKKLFLSSVAMLFTSLVNLVFLFSILLYVFFIFDFTPCFNIVPWFMVEAKNSYKHLFIIFLCLIIVLLYLFISFLKLGVKRWFYLLTKDKTTSFLQIFYYYSTKERMREALMLKGTILIKVLFDILISLTPGTALFLFSAIKMQMADQNKKIMFAGLMVASATIFIIAFLFFIKRLLIYKFYKVLFFSGGITNINQDIKKIKFILERNKLDNFKFLFSFTFYFLSCFLIFPALIVLPYLKMEWYTHLERSIKNADNKHSKPKTKLFYININQNL